MKRKIIAIGIILMFLFTGVTVVSSKQVTKVAVNTKSTKDVADNTFDASIFKKNNESDKDNGHVFCYIVSYGKASAYINFGIVGFPLMMVAYRGDDAAQTIIYDKHPLLGGKILEFKEGDHGTGAILLVGKYPISLPFIGFKPKKDFYWSGWALYADAYYADD